MPKTVKSKASNKKPRRYVPSGRFVVAKPAFGPKRLRLADIRRAVREANEEQAAQD